MNSLEKVTILVIQFHSKQIENTHAIEGQKEWETVLRCDQETRKILFIFISIFLFFSPVSSADD